MSDLTMFDLEHALTGMSTLFEKERGVGSSSEKNVQDAIRFLLTNVPQKIAEEKDADYFFHFCTLFGRELVIIGVRGDDKGEISRDVGDLLAELLPKYPEMKQQVKETFLDALSEKMGPFERDDFVYNNTLILAGALAKILGPEFPALVGAKLLLRAVCKPFLNAPDDMAICSDEPFFSQDRKPTLREAVGYRSRYGREALKHIIVAKPEEAVKFLSELGSSCEKEMCPVVRELVEQLGQTVLEIVGEEALLAQIAHLQTTALENGETHSLASLRRARQVIVGTNQNKEEVERPMLQSWWQGALTHG